MENKKQLAQKIEIAQKAYLVARACYEAKRNLAEECQEKVLANNEFLVSDEWKDERTSGKIVKPFNSYLMSDDDFQKYLDLCFAEYTTAGIAPINKEKRADFYEQQKLREAEEHLLNLGEEMCAASKKFTPEYLNALKKARTISIEKRKELLDLLLTLDTKTM